MASIQLSQWYLDLELPFAAKYHALAATYASVSSGDEDIKKIAAPALAHAMDADYAIGAWGAALVDLDLMLEIHHAIMPEPLDLTKHPHVQRGILEAITMLAISERIDKSFSNQMLIQSDRVGLRDAVSELLPTARLSWESVPDIWKHLESNFHFCPFSDAGPIRLYRWNQLGLTWNCRFENTWLATALAEQLCASLQIILCDLADEDLLLMRSSITLEVHFEINGEFRVESRCSNQERVWEVSLPVTLISSGREELLNLQSNIVAIAFSVLYDCSLMKHGKVLELLKAKLDGGLNLKSLIHDTYASLYTKIFDEDLFTKAKLNMGAPSGVNDFPAKGHASMAWIDAIGTTYNSSFVRTSLDNRYRNLQKLTRFTVPRLVQEPAFRETVRSLRARGLLDWHILTAISALSMNYLALSDPHMRTSRELQQDQIDTLMEHGEAHDADKVPIDYFSFDQLMMQHRLNLTASLKIFDLELHQDVPDIPAIMDFQKVRYRYYSDDIEHSDPF